MNKNNAFAPSASVPFTFAPSASAPFLVRLTHA